MAFVGAVHSGAVEEGMQAMAPLRQLAQPVLDASGPTTYVELQSRFDPPAGRGELRAYWKSQYLDELNDDAIRAVAAIGLERPEPLGGISVLHMGGAIAAVEPDATAFWQRTPPFLVSIEANWEDAGRDDELIAWARAATARVAEHGTGGVYLNFSGRAGEPPGAGVGAAAGPNLRRLAQVKAEYDPANFFRINDNVPPAPLE